MAPSKYSRLIAKLRGLPIFEQCHDELILQAFDESFLDGKNVVIDATHIEARDAANPEKKRSRKKDGNKKAITKQNELFPGEPKEEVQNPEPKKPKKAKVDFDISCLVYTLSKLAVDRINKQMNEMEKAV